MFYTCFTRILKVKWVLQNVSQNVLQKFLQNVLQNVLQKFLQNVLQFFLQICLQKFSQNFSQNVFSACVHVRARMSALFGFLGRFTIVHFHTHPRASVV